MPPRQRQRPINPEQGQLLATGPGGQLREYDVSGELGERGVDPIAQNIHLLNALDGIAHITQLDGMLMSAQYPGGKRSLERTYKTGINQVIANVEARRKSLALGVRWEFARADGMFDRIDSGLQTPEEATAQTRGAFNEFIGKYAGTHKSEARDEYRKQLADEITALEVAETQKNKREHLRPHQIAGPRDRTLDSRSRLHVISADPRAGFLPTTHREKTVVMALLDYLDNPEHPIGVRHQTLEIGGFHIKKAREAEAKQQMTRQEGIDNWLRAKRRGVDTAWSTTYELGDFLMSATHQLFTARLLQQELLQPISPTITLTEAIGPDHAAYAGLKRFSDLRTLRDKGVIDGEVPYSPLHPRRNETADELSQFPRKNKVLEDPYTGADINPAYAARIAAFPDETTVVEGRRLAGAAIDDAEKRSFLMLKVLRDFHTTTHERLLGPASQAADIVLKHYAQVVQSLDLA